MQILSHFFCVIRKKIVILQRITINLLIYLPYEKVLSAYRLLRWGALYVR